MRNTHWLVTALVATFAVGCIADVDSSDPQMQMEPEPAPEAMPEPAPEPMPEPVPEPMPEPDPTPEPIAPSDDWLPSCFGIDSATGGQALVLSGASATVQQVGDVGAPSIVGGEWNGWHLAAFTARFDGLHYFQGWHSDLVALRSDCTATHGVDPGNGYPEMRLSLTEGETVFLVTERISRTPQGIRVEQPKLRPQAVPESRGESFHFVRVYGHPSGRCNQTVKFDAQWDNESEGRTLIAWDGDTELFQASRFWSSDDASWWASVLEFDVGRVAESYRFALVNFDGETIDEVEVAVQPAAQLAAGEECDPEEIRSVCLNGLSCTGRFCAPTE